MEQERFTRPPLVAHGPDNRGAVVVVISYSFMFITMLFAILRLCSSYIQKRDLRWDDLTFSLAALLIIPESILTERAVGQGLGQHISAVAASKLVQYYKYIYASQILGIIIQSLAKFSVILMIERIASELSTKKANLLVKVMIGIWFLFSLFAIAFQCGIPRPWEFTKEKCIADGKLYYVIVAGTTATDGVLACYFIPIVWKLQMGRSLRLLVSFLFAVRLIVCAVSIPYIALFPKYLSSDDKTWDNANLQIFHQVVVNLSVTTAGIPSLRRLLSDLQTGKLAMVLNDREIELTTSGRSKTRSHNNSKIDSSNTSGMFSRSKWGTSSQHSKSHAQPYAGTLNSSKSIRLRPDETARYTTYVVGGSGSNSGAERDARKRKNQMADATKSDDEINDDKSTSSLRKNGVYQQRDFEMHVEYDTQDGESR